MSVAVAVLSGRARAGLGIKTAALKLDFFPVVTESYDLVIPEVYYNLPNVQALLCTIQSAQFKQRVMGFGGIRGGKNRRRIVPFELGF